MNIVKKIWCRTFQLGMYCALPILPYREPEVHYSLEDLGEIFRKRKVSRVLIVTDKGLVAANLCGLLEQVLTEQGIEYSVYSDTVPNPTVHNVEHARKQYIETHAQAFIALGGGSSMDCAKAAACRIARPRTSVHHMGGILRVWKRLPLLVAIPTTAGTGSETTLAAVIKDTETHHKYAIMDFPLIPRVAVLDYRLTLKLPPHITAATGMDALVHAVEAYIGRSTNHYTRKMAIEAVSLIRQNLLQAFQNGSNAEARQQMLRAAFCAGNAFSRSYVGYIHAVAHSIGGQYGTAHGLANAVLMPIVLKMYGKAAEKKLASLARRSGVVEFGYNDTDTAHLFIEWIQQMNDQMNIPRTLDDIKEEDIDHMVVYAEKEANPLYPVPVLWGEEELKQVYYNAITK